jgi:hypothetical protein
MELAYIPRPNTHPLCELTPIVAVPHGAIFQAIYTSGIQLHLEEHLLGIHHSIKKPVRDSLRRG